MNALPTIITPAKGSMQELVQSRQDLLSISLSYGTLFATRGDTSISVRFCPPKEFFSDHTCQPCANDEGTYNPQAITCISCG